MAGHLRYRRLHKVMLAPIRRLSIALILAVAVAGTIGASVAGATGTGVGCGPLGCGAGAADGGNPSGPSDPSSGNSGSGNSGGGSNTPPPCSAVALSPPPEASSPWWGGHTAAEGVVVHWVCTNGSQPVSLVPFFQANGTVTPPPVDPAVLAQEAYKQIPTPTPVMHFGPDEAQVAVKVPVWLWVNRPALNPVTVTAGAVSVTATPEVTSVTWSMGDPVDPTTSPAPWQLRGPVVCTGDAMYEAAPATAAWNVQPACGYTYHWVSTAARTNGSEKWTVSATVAWDIKWTSNNGATGQIAGPPATSVAQLRVGQWTTIAVPPAGN